MKQLFILFISLSVCFEVYSQDPTKGFESLNKKDFDAAKAIFTTLLKSEDTGEKPFIYYGIAAVYQSSQSPYLNLDTAYYYSRKAEFEYNNAGKKQHDYLLKKYQFVLTKILNQKYLISQAAFKKVNVASKSELQEFIEKFKYEKTVQNAQDALKELQVFENFPENKTADFYQDLITKYPKNPQINKAWMKLYEILTGDGSLLTLQMFSLDHPQFPFDSLLKKDLDIYKFGSLHKCTEFVLDGNKEFCRQYITKAAPKHSAYTALQIFLRQDIDKKNWKEVKQELEYFKPFFKGDSDFASLQHIFFRDEVVIEPKKLGSNINTPGQEYSPVVSANGKHLYFCGTKRTDNLGGEDIYVSEWKDNGWSKAELMHELSTKQGNEAPEAISTDETKMVMYANGDILFTEKSSSGWSKPKPVSDINTTGWDGDAVFTPDGKAIIFASEGWKKVGTQYPSRSRKDEFDIYISFKTATGWSVPLNLGTTVNTPWCDRYPFLHPDGKTLYFSSEGHGSMGGADVYRSTRLYDTSWVYWSKPENLGKYINTTGDDNGYKLTTDGLYAYFSVNKNNDIDIYTTEIPKDLRPGNVAVVSGTVRDENKATLAVDIAVEDLQTGEKIATFASSPEDGTFVIVLQMGRNYGFYASKLHYYPASKNLDLRNKNQFIELQQDIGMVSIKSMVDKGIPITINNVFFDTDKFDLRKESSSELSRLADILKSNLELQISIEGHTDNDGSADHNTILSLNRAKSVKQFLIDHSVDETRIIIFGFGSSRPVADNNTSEGKQINRRVEVRFTKVTK